MKHRLLAFILVSTLAGLVKNHLSAQMVGGTFSGQSAPKEVKASELSKGAATSDVNLFTGTMATGYDLGTVSTPSGLSFNLQLSHSSTKSVNSNPLVVAGIPYGDGWNINVPTISISSSGYQKYSDIQVAISLESATYYANQSAGNGAKNYADYSKKELAKEGELAWYSPVISIPGVVNERFIFKAFDRTLGEAVFVPANMDSYVEARMKYGSYWKVTNHNGDVYSFTGYSTGYRTAPQLNLTEDSLRLTPTHVVHLDSTSFSVDQSNNDIIHYLSGTDHLNIKIDSRSTSSTGKLVIVYWIISGSFAMQDNLLPKQEFDTWYCDYIYNKNSPLSQQINFHYNTFGAYDFYQEFNQPYLNQQLSQDYRIASGSIPAFKFNRDVILESVSSYYKDRGMIEEIDLLHQTVNPAANTGQRNMLLITEPSVMRLDSLYNYRIVYSQGVNTAKDSSLLGSNAYNYLHNGLSFNAGANIVNSSFANWRRYLHVMSDDPTATAGRLASAAGTQHHPAFATTSNPYLFSSASAGSYGHPFYKYKAAIPNFSSNDLSFSHGFLESPRIQEDIIPGDIYEVRSVIKNYNTNGYTGGSSVKACNFDVNIVSGYPVPIGNITYPFVENGNGTDLLDENDYVTGTRGVNIFSTFGNPLKWTSYAHTNGQTNTGDPADMAGITNTSNFFLMPTIPKKFRGVNIQVGPANADIDYALNQQQVLSYTGKTYNSTNYRRSSYLAYKKIQEDHPNGQHYPNEPFPNPHFKPSQNFGIGMPWYMLSETYTRLSGSPYYDQANPNTFFWWKDTNYPVLETGIDNYTSQPTMADDNVSLSAMELVRYSKNPYMLVSVQKYKYNGYATNDALIKNKYLVSQLNLNYQVKVDSLFTNTYAYKNVVITKDTTIGCVTYSYNLPGHTITFAKVLIAKEFVGFQNAYLLSTIRQIPVNAAMGNATSPFVAANMPTTRFQYKKVYSDSLSNVIGKYDFTGNLYVIQKIVDQMGGVMEYEYYPLHDTKHTRWVDLYRDFNYSGQAPANLYNLPKPDVYKVQIAVKTKRYYTTTVSTLPSKTWRYEYSDNLPAGQCQNGSPVNVYGISPSAILLPQYRFNSIQLDFGFKKTTVSYPQLAAGTAVPYDVYTHYTNENTFHFFGKVQTIQKYDAANNLLNKKEYIYKSNMAYGNIMMTNNQWAAISGYQNLGGDEYYYRGNLNYPYNLSTVNDVIDEQQLNLSMNTDYKLMPFLEMTSFNAFRLLNSGHYSNSYFVRLVKEINTDYDWSILPDQTLPVITQPALRGIKLIDVSTINASAPLSSSPLKRRGIRIPLTELLYGIRPVKLGLADLAILDLPGSHTLPSFMQVSEMSTVTDYDYWDADSSGVTSSDGFRRLLNHSDSTTNKIRLTFEPSWELFRKTVTSPQLAQAYKKTEYYYYYDAKQDINVNNSDYPHPDKFDALYYSQKYGIRNLPYEKRDIAKAVSHDEVSKSEYYWYDTKTKTDMVPTFDTLYISGPITCPGAGTVSPTNPPTPDYGNTIGCIAVPHPFSPPPAGYQFTQTGPNTYMYCPIAIADPGSTHREYLFPSDLRTKLLLRRVDEQVDTIRANVLNVNKYNPLLRFKEFSIGDSVISYNYTWGANYFTKVKYRTLQHTPLGFVREDVNERGLHTFYGYHTVYSTSFIDIQNPCNKGGAYDLTNQGVPECITVGYGRPDALTTCYKYNPDFTVDSITDPNNMVLSYRYDPFSRLQMALRNNDTLSVNAYSQWLNDTTLNFEQRAAQNYVESYILLNKGSTVAEHSRAYLDPLGRKYDVQTQVTANYTNPLVFDTLMIHSGLTTFDNWDRVVKQYKPFKFVNPGSAPVPFAPRFNSPGALYTEQQYEANQRGQVLRAAKFGENILTGHTVNSSYQVISGTQMASELGPYVFVFINEITGTTTLAGISAQRYLKTAMMDEDGKKTVSYTNVFGQKVASKTYINAYTEAVTAFMYDSQGNLKKVTDPKLRSTTYEYNLCGNMFRKVTADADTARYLYDISGNVVLERDANGTHGVDEPTVKPYLRKYTYDAYGRMTLQDRMYYEVSLDPLRYAPFVKVDSIHPFYNFSYGSSLDYVTGWMYYKCYLAYRPVPVEDPNGPVNPAWPPLGPNQPELKPCQYLFISPYDSLVLAAHEKAWIYHIGVSGYDPDLTFSFYQSNLNGRLSLAKSYTHAGAFSNLNAYSYNKAGLMEKELVLFKKPQGGTLYSLLTYPSYNLRNSLLEQQVDVNADGTNEMAYSYSYDGWNRLRGMKVKRGAGAFATLAAYDYDDALGLLKSMTYYDPNAACTHAVDQITYAYDARNRLTELNSVLYNEKLYYDLNGPLTAQPAFGVAATPNFNGNINGLIHNYRLNLTANYVSTAGMMDSSTVYGYTYDGINRLTAADASVLNVLNYAAGPSVYSPKLAYGDETMVYDPIGNITDLNRGLYYHSSTPVAGSAAQNWHYNYMGYANRLASVDSVNNLPLRRYNYDMNGNSNLQIIGKSKSRSDYMRSNLPKHITASSDTTSSTVMQLTYDYNNHDDRIYKENATGSSAFHTYSLRDASGKEVAELDMDKNLWTYYAYGRERISEIRGTGITFCVNDHLGSQRVAYNTVSGCSPNYTIYRLESAIDYYAFGKTLRSFNNNSKYSYQGSEKNRELGDNEYYTHFRGLDVDIARWKGVDPKWSPSESPYISMGNNPVMNNDPLGDTIVVNLYGLYDAPAYHQMANNAVLNQKDDGVFLVFGHGRAGAIQYEGKDGSKQAVETAEGFNIIVSEKSPEYKDAMENKKPVIVKLLSCNAESKEYYTHDGDVRKTDEPIAEKISKNLSDKNSHSLVIAANGYVNTGVNNGKASLNGIRQTTATEHENTKKGSWITLKNGKEIGRQLDAFIGNSSPSKKGPYKKD